MPAPFDADSTPDHGHSVACPHPSSVLATAPKDSDPSHTQDAMDEEISGLRHVVDELPRKLWISLLVGGAERFTFYVVSTPWRKFVLRIRDEYPKLSCHDRELHAE